MGELLHLSKRASIPAPNAARSPPWHLSKRWGQAMLPRHLFLSDVTSASLPEGLSGAPKRNIGLLPQVIFTPETQPWAITYLQNIPRNELLQVAKGYMGRRLGNSKNWTENPWDSWEIRRLRRGCRHHEECLWKLQDLAS